MKNTIPLTPPGSPSRTPRWARALAAISVSSPREAFSLPLALAIGALGMATGANAQTTIFTENLGVPTRTTAIATYATGTAPATFQNKGILTYGTGDLAGAADIRATSFSTGYTGASGAGNVFFTGSSAAGDRGFSIESINASSFNTLQLSYAYRKNSVTAFAGLSVDYWSGASWVTVANASDDLFSELATASFGWYPAKTLSLPAGAQIDGLKIRFVKSGTIELRIDDIKLTGSPAGGDVTNPTIASLSPPNNSINVATTVSLVANFDEAIKEGTGNIVLETTLDNTPIAATVSIAGSTLTITPTEILDYETSYTVVIPPGSITDLTDNEFGGVPETAAWTFTTVEEDITEPLAVSFTPANNSTNVNPPSTLSITFDEVVDFPWDEAFLTVKDSEGNQVAQVDTSFFGSGVTISGAVATITLPAPLDYGVTYYVEVDPWAFEDLSGNPFAGFTGSATWSFTTADVPELTPVPYTQNFGSFASASNLTDARVLLPFGWSATGPDLSYDGNFGTSNTGGFRGNDNVLGYQPTGSTGILVKTLTLRNATEAEITDLVVSYVGRAGLVVGREPFYVVTINGVEVPALTYSTASNDGTVVASTVSGLSIPVGETFAISWAVDGPNAPGSGGRRQIGISSVSVQAGVLVFAPGVAAASADYATLTQSSVAVSSAVTSDGGGAITERGFVYSISSINPTPTIGGTGVTKAEDEEVLVGPYSAALSGLASSTQYALRAYATNSQGTTYSSVLDIFTLAPPPSLVTNYLQPFNNFSGSIVTGTLPTGWTVTSTGGLNGYAGGWGPGTSSGGLLGGVTGPGVLGYQHTGGTGMTTMTLKLTNGTGGVLDELYVSYLGRVARIAEGRSPEFIVSINGSLVPALAYSTSGNEDSTVSSTLTGLDIQPGALITITWVSELGAGSGANKQIGLADVYVGLEPPVAGNTYTDWATTNVNGQGPALDFDGDGVPNGVEYFMGTAPNAFTANPGIVSGAVTWPRAADTTIASFKVEVSTNLSTWENATVNYAANLNISASQVVFTMPAGPTKLFVRLNVVP